MNNKAVLNAMLREDLYLFVQRVFREVAPGEEFSSNWHIEAMCYALTEIGLKRTRRQVIEVPPRSLKTICSSVALVAWLLGRDPTRKIICISYAQDLAARFSAMTRQVMKSEWYRELFPGTAISPTKDTETYFRTTAGGYRDATSVGGVLTGKGADLIVIDDPGKPDEMASEVQRNNVNTWFDRTLYSRLNNKQRDGILIVMQRLHVEDLAGHVRSRGDWLALTIPAIAPEDARIQLGPDRWHQRYFGEVVDPARETKADLDQTKQALGSFVFSAQYQQEPMPTKGSVIDWRWFRTFAEPPNRDRVRIVQSWDCASKKTEFSDYSVCMTWAVYNGEYFLLDIFRKKLTFPELVAAALKLGGQYGPDEILIEDAAAGIQLFQQLRLERPCRMPRPIAIKPVGDKVTRAHTSSLVIEQGRVFLPLNAPWLDDLKSEVLQFPFGRHDDQIDSMSQFLAREEHRRLNGPSVQRRSIYGWEDDRPAAKRLQPRR